MKSIRHKVLPKQWFEEPSGAFPSQSPKKQKKPIPKKFLHLFIPSSNIKKILTFSQKKACLIFSQIKPCNFHPKLQKQKKTTLGKFLILQETKTLKSFLCFPKRKESFSYISENENPEAGTLKKLLLFQVTCLKYKKLLYFFV